MATWTANNASRTAQAQAAKVALSNATGVNIDSEMANLISLQNSYAANARVMSVVQTMMTSLMQVQV